MKWLEIFAWAWGAILDQNPAIPRRRRGDVDTLKNETNSGCLRLLLRWSSRLFWTFTDHCRSDKLVGLVLIGDLNKPDRPRRQRSVALPFHYR